MNEIGNKEWKVIGETTIKKEDQHYSDITEIRIGRIYLITNLINNNKYVGQTIRTLHDRWRDHRKNYKNKNYLINYAINKYGHENFSIKEVCKIFCNDVELLINRLNTLEIHYIKKYKSFADWNVGGYNLTTGGGQHNLSDSTKKKLSDHFKGIPRPEYVKNKIRNALKGRTRDKHIDDFKMKIYKITFSNNSTEKIKGLKRFCKERKYDARALFRLKNKEITFHKDIKSIESILV